MITGVSQAARSGMQEGMQTMRQSAQEIATQRIEGGSQQRDIAEPLVEMKEGQRQVESSAKVFQASGEAFKSLIDVMA